MANPVNDDPADPAPAEPAAGPITIKPELREPFAWAAQSCRSLSSVLTPAIMEEAKLAQPVMHAIPIPVTHLSAVAGPSCLGRPQVQPNNQNMQPKTATGHQKLTTKLKTVSLNDGPAETRPKNRKRKPTKTCAAETVTTASLDPVRNDQPEVPQLRKKHPAATVTALPTSSASNDNPEKLLKNKMKQLETATASADLETVLENVKKVDNTCSFSKCKKRTADFAIDCKYCSGRFCTTHGLPEIHGCGEAVRRDARRNFLHPEPHVSKDKHDKAQTKLNLKLRQMEQERKGKGPSKDKKK